MTKKKRIPPLGGFHNIKMKKKKKGKRMSEKWFSNEILILKNEPFVFHGLAKIFFFIYKIEFC